MNTLESYNVIRRRFLKKEITPDEFSDVRSTIAEELASHPPPTLNDILHNRVFRLWKLSQRYDRHLVEGILLPGVYETIHATEIINPAVRETENAFAEVSGLLIVGSYAWGANYALRMSEVSDHVDSDVDFEVILDRKEDWDIVINSPLLRQDSKFIYGFSSFRQLYEQGLADYFSHKVIIKEVETSLHFTPLSTLTSLCRFPLSNFEGVSTFREIRIIPKTKPPLYNLSNFRRRRYPFDCVIEQINDLILTHTPKQVTIGGELFLGVLANKLLHSPLVLRDKIGIQQELLHLAIEVIRRISREENRFGDQRFLTLGLVGSSITPRYILKHIMDMKDKLRDELSLK